MACRRRSGGPNPLKKPHILPSRTSVPMWRWLASPGRGGDAKAGPSTPGPPKKSELAEALANRGTAKPQEKTTLYPLTERIWAFVHGACKCMNCTADWAKNAFQLAGLGVESMLAQSLLWRSWRRSSVPFPACKRDGGADVLWAKILNASGCSAARRPGAEIGNVGYGGVHAAQEGSTRVAFSSGTLYQTIASLHTCEFVYIISCSL